MLDRDDEDLSGCAGIAFWGAICFVLWPVFVCVWYAAK